MYLDGQIMIVNESRLSNHDCQYI